MRIVMPIGMVLMLISLILGRSRLNGAAILRAVTTLPSAPCFAVGVLGMALMIVFAAKLDSSDVRANWIEQLTNGIAQGAIFLGLLLLIR